jgi:hypothetical protein
MTSAAEIEELEVGEVTESILRGFKREQHSRFRMHWQNLKTIVLKVVSGVVTDDIVTAIWLPKHTSHRVEAAMI